MSEEALKRAKKRVKKKKGFYGHLGAFITVNAFMMMLMVVSGDSVVEWLVPMSGWGIGLAMHYFGVFGFPGSGAGGAEWEEKQLKKELKKEGYELDQFEEIEDGLELKDLDSEEAEAEGEIIKRQWRDEDMV